MRIIIDLHPALDETLRRASDRHHLTPRGMALDVVTRFCEAEAEAERQQGQTEEPEAVA
jgi:hypothetical protein